jgi:S-adenosylmethionine:tRNA ribosyltransferase-isomerase
MSVDLHSVEAYDFHLPEERIAKFPVTPRDTSRLLVLHRKSGEIQHRQFLDLPEYFGVEDLLIANNTKVLKARLVGRRILPNNEVGGKVEMLLLEKRGEKTWEGAFQSTGRQVPGFRFRVERSGSDSSETIDCQFIEGEIIHGSSESPSGTVVVRFSEDPVEAGCGDLPLPHYLQREKVLQSDEERYQTVFAKELGSAAAPTAGLHFTPRVMDALNARGAQWSEVTLHVGLGTFRPVKTEKITDHSMHEERYVLPSEVARKILDHRKNGGRVTAVGTTSVRTLESAYVQPSSTSSAPHFLEGEQRTDIFLYPGSRPFQVVDRLITNFHLPKSTLLMLVSAFAGRDLALRAYAEAVEKEYRFFSYGDAMLIL